MFKPGIMDKITHEEMQLARKISRALQKYLYQTGLKNARSTDVYEYLAREGLVEKDHHNGLFFRKFLDRLNRAGLLKLIPQCIHGKSQNGANEWYFRLVSEDKSELNDLKQTGKEAVIVHKPQMAKDEINQLINDESPNVKKLSKRDSSGFNLQELETRRNYPRAYEYWSKEEYDILSRFYLSTKNVDKAAELLQRQPHIVKEKLEERRLL